MRRRSLLISLVSPALAAQQQGVPAEWEIRKFLEELKTLFAAIPPQLDKLNLESWRNAGAPEAYLSQAASTRRQISSVGQAIEELRQSPEKLSIALEIFLRFNALDQMSASVVEAARKYESQDLADQLEATIVSTAAPRDRFRRYLLDLAAERDRQFEILSKEAQRCRADHNLPRTITLPKPIPKKELPPQKQ